MQSAVNGGREVARFFIRPFRGEAVCLRVEEILERARALSEPVVASQGMELIEVEFATERGRPILRFYIDKPGGVTLDDCQAISREVEGLLEVEDPIPGRYFLEVSSPGLDRPLRREEDFRRYQGRRARVRLLEPREGRRRFTGRISSVTSGSVTFLLEGGEQVELPLAQVAKARLEYEGEDLQGDRRERGRKK